MFSLTNKDSDPDYQLRLKLIEVTKHFDECSEHPGYTNAAQAVYRGVVHELERILEETNGS